MPDRREKGDALAFAFASLHRLAKCGLWLACEIGGSDIAPPYFDGEVEPSMQSCGNAFERSTKIDRKCDAS